MPTPTTYPSAKQFVQIAKETTQGTPVTTGMVTMPVTAFTPKDEPVWLEDTGMRGSMSDVYGLIQGPRKGAYSFSGAVFLSWLGHHLLNIMGAVDTSGPVVSIYTHIFSQLNSGTGQPPSHTLVDWQGLTPTTQARVYPGASHSELVLKGNPESTLIEWSAKGNCFWSSAFPTSPPTSAPDATSPIAAWRVELGFGGALPGAKNLTVRDWEITLTREISVQHTSQNSQEPYIIQRGKLGGTFKFFVAKPSDETFLDYMRNNTQPQFQLLVSNGLAGASAQTMQVDAAATGVRVADVNRGDEAVGYDVSGTFIHNTTSAGASGGYAPCKFTITNAVVSY